MTGIAAELARRVTATAGGELPPLALERAKMSVASTVASAARALPFRPRARSASSRSRAAARRRRRSGFHKRKSSMSPARRRSTR